MKSTSPSSWLFLAAALLGGCAVTPLGTDEGQEVTGSAEEAVEYPNALNANALNANALYPNALNANALNANALNANALSATALAAIHDPGPAGHLSRQLLKYTVSCALHPNQSVNFTWTDSDGEDHQQSYPGLIGLAPSWANKPLSDDGQQWVSACLASRVNWYGVSVILSSRGHNGAIDKGANAPAEITSYTHNEGAFWGNLFTASPALYACHDAPNDGYSRSKDRDCAVGHLSSDGTVSECGIIHIVGPCATHCQSLGSGQYYPHCRSDLAGKSSDTDRVVTVFLD